MTKKLAPIHPGEVLLEDFMRPHGLTANRLALILRVSPNRLTEIINGRRSISADTALRLARYFGTSAEVWLNMQAAYDLSIAEDELGQTIRREVPVGVA